MQILLTAWTKVLAKKLLIVFVVGMILGTVYGKAIATATVAVVTDPSGAVARLQVQPADAAGKK